MINKLALDEFVVLNKDRFVPFDRKALCGVLFVS